ncbi:YdeI/OmpD-associated family protein [Streptomyces syringium]|uniref:YdeI/OmpD-associated family protein n=1 Tax=Streptomyces syringium TaxID=76729 RepID=UPI003D8D9E30
MPPDLAAALDTNPDAVKAFEALDRTGRYLTTLPSGHGRVRRCPGADPAPLI